MTFNFKQEYLAILLPSIPDDLYDELSKELSEFVYWQESELQDFRLSSQQIQFLTVQGLPKQSSPFLGFNHFSRAEILQIQQDNDLENYHLPIGTDGSGNIIYIDYLKGVYLSDHDNNCEKIFINTTLEQFAQSICAYTKGHRNLKNLTIYQAIDEKVGKQKDFWQMELS